MCVVNCCYKKKKELVRKIAYIIIVLKWAFFFVFISFVCLLHCSFQVICMIIYSVKRKSPLCKKGSMRGAKIQQGDRKHLQVF